MTGPTVSADQGMSLRVRLSGFHEVTNPLGGGAISTRASGLFVGRIGPNASEIDER